MGEEPNHTTARNPRPLEIVQYSLAIMITYLNFKYIILYFQEILQLPSIPDCGPMTVGTISTT